MSQKRNGLLTIGSRELYRKLKSEIYLFSNKNIIPMVEKKTNERQLDHSTRNNRSIYMAGLGLRSD